MRWMKDPSAARRSASAVEAPNSDRSLAELRALAVRVGANPDLWTSRLPRESEERTYTGVHWSDHLGVWAISWMAPDHDTGFHDHDRSRGAVFVAEGAICHEHMRTDGTTDRTLVRAGDSFVFDETAIHRMRFDSLAGSAVTIHAYSPPLEWTGQYELTNVDGCLHRIPTSSEQPLKPH